MGLIEYLGKCLCDDSKKGDKHLIKNYRPISLLSTCGKRFEKIILYNLYNHLSAHHYQQSLQPSFCTSPYQQSLQPSFCTSPYQQNLHGFRPGDSTTNQLIDSIEQGGFLLISSCGSNFGAKGFLWDSTVGNNKCSQWSRHTLKKHSENNYQKKTSALSEMYNNYKYHPRTGSIWNNISPTLICPARGSLW